MILNSRLHQLIHFLFLLDSDRFNKSLFQLFSDHVDVVFFMDRELGDYGNYAFLQSGTIMTFANSLNSLNGLTHDCTSLNEQRLVLDGDEEPDSLGLREDLR